MLDLPAGGAYGALPRRYKTHHPLLFIITAICLIGTVLTLYFMMQTGEGIIYGEEVSLSQLLKVASEHPSRRNVKVFDVFLYNGDLTTEYRMKLLAPVVDRFYIIESTVTFTGIRKQVLFRDLHADAFRPYEEKIKWIILDESDYTEALAEVTRRSRTLSGLGKRVLDIFFRGQKAASARAWAREKFTRNAPLKIIQEEWSHQEPTDFVAMICDGDEIPSPELVRSLKTYAAFETLANIEQKATTQLDNEVTSQHITANQNCPSSRISMAMILFYYNLRWRKKYRWNEPFLLTSRTVLNKACDTNFHALRLSDESAATIYEAGFHCSSCDSIDNLKRKVESFSHQEFNKLHLKSSEHLKYCIETGRDMFNRGSEEDLIRFEGSLPPTLEEFQRHLGTLQ